MSQGERCEVEGGVTRGSLGPVEDAGDRGAVDEDVLDVEVAVDEHRSPRPEHGSRPCAVGLDDVGREDLVLEEPVALPVE